jgi:prepilin-type N-terminal cleavage/methylation domain-containing protein
MSMPAVIRFLSQRYRSFGSVRPCFARNGFSLIELAIVIGIILILAGTASMLMINTGEKTDASNMESLHGTLQSSLLGLMDRLDKTYPEIVPSDMTSMINVIEHGIQQGTAQPLYTLTFDGTNFVVVSNKSHRTATYSVDVNGKVTVTAITGFKQNQICDGKIQALQIPCGTTTTPHQ